MTDSTEIVIKSLAEFRNRVKKGRQKFIRIFLNIFGYKKFIQTKGLELLCKYAQTIEHKILHLNITH